MEVGVGELADVALNVRADDRLEGERDVRLQLGVGDLRVAVAVVVAPPESSIVTVTWSVPGAA